MFCFSETHIMRDTCTGGIAADGSHLLQRRLGIHPSHLIAHTECINVGNLRYGNLLCGK